MEELKAKIEEILKLVNIPKDAIAKRVELSFYFGSEESKTTYEPDNYFKIVVP